MDRRLDSLSGPFKPLAIELCARLVEVGIPILIANTLRTAAEQADALRTGHSWTQHSRHLTGDAIDVVPYDTYQLRGPDKLDWDAADPVWLRVGAVGQRIHGLKWGVWKDGKNIDPGHFELGTT